MKYLIFSAARVVGNAATLPEAKMFAWSWSNVTQQDTWVQRAGELETLAEFHYGDRRPDGGAQ
jgi:hypothetical protein